MALSFSNENLNKTRGIGFLRVGKTNTLETMIMCFISQRSYYELLSQLRENPGKKYPICEGRSRRSDETNTNTSLDRKPLTLPESNAS